MSFNPVGLILHLLLSDLNVVLLGCSSIFSSVLKFYLLSNVPVVPCLKDSLLPLVLSARYKTYSSTDLLCLSVVPLLTCKGKSTVLSELFMVCFNSSILAFNSFFLNCYSELTLVKLMG